MEQRRTVQPAAEGGQRQAEQYSGWAILVLCLAIGLVTVTAGPDPYLPIWLWAALFVGCLIALFLSVLSVADVPLGPWRPVVYAAAVVTSWTVLLTMPNDGMLVVLLVVIAAAGTAIIPMWAVMLTVGLNSLMVVLHFSLRGLELFDWLSVAIFYLIIHLAAVLSTYALVRESRLRAELEEKNVELTTASVLLEDSAKTSERLRISRELHDLIGHQLTVLNLELEAAKHREGEQVREHLEQAAAVAKELLADVRSTVGELRQSDPGELHADLERIAAAVPSVQISVEAEDDIDADEQQTEALLRAAQEIITNAVKHAEAEQLTLTLACDDGHIRLTGVDDGISPTSIHLGYGLSGLQERVELLGGELQVTPSPEFTVEVRLPVGGPAGPASQPKEPRVSQEVR